MTTAIACRCALVPAVLASAFAVPAVGGETIDVAWSTPTFDRWMYPFNGTPGDRALSSVFSSLPAPGFDQRDGQALLGFATATDVPDGLPPSAYVINSAVVTIMVASEDTFELDTTQDAWQTWVPVEDGGAEDADPGRPVMLNGTAFRNAWDAWSFGEHGPFPFGAGPGQRNAYPIMIHPDGTIADVSNNVSEAFDPVPFAIGTADGLEDGDIVPTGTTLRFHVDVNDPQVQCYLRRSLSEGIVDFTVTSLHGSTQPGVAGEATEYPDLFMKENLAVELGLADAASFTLSVTVTEPSGVPGDIDGDGVVDVNDLLEMLNLWGPCACCFADLDGSGAVDVADLLFLLSAWR